MSEYIIEDILDAFQYVPYGIGIGVFVCIMVYIYQYYKGRDKVSYPAVFLLTVYLVVLSCLVFFNRAVGSRDGLTPELFGTMGHGVRGDSYVVENILLFFPFGFLSPFAWKKMKSIRYCVPAACLFSCGIEALQFVTKRGFCQLDDVVMNTLGAFWGWLLFSFLFLLWKQGRRHV